MVLPTVFDHIVFDKHQKKRGMIAYTTIPLLK